MFCFDSVLWYDEGAGQRDLDLACVCVCVWDYDDFENWWLTDPVCPLAVISALEAEEK